MGGCETERRSEVGKLRPVDKARTERRAPKKPRTLVLLAFPYTPEQRETNRCFLGAPYPDGRQTAVEKREGGT